MDIVLNGHYSDIEGTNNDNDNSNWPWQHRAVDTRTS
jgi:hypothetical protein